MRFQGRITEWRDDQGFGFVTPNGGGDPAFLHIKAFSRHGRRPAEGDLVNYQLTKDSRGRLRAESVEYARLGKPPPKPLNLKYLFLLVGFGFLAIVALEVAKHRLPFALAALYFGASLVTFIVYFIDKSAAQSGNWRTPESTLQLMSLAGGWPGGLVAQHVLRHKNRKGPFQVVFWVTVALNIGAFAWLHTAIGTSFLSALLAR